MLEGDAPVSHRQFRDFPDLLKAGDLLVLNRSRVVPARILGTTRGGGLAEVLLLGRHAGSSDLFRAIVRPGRKLRKGQSMTVADGVSIRIERVEDDGIRVVSFDGPLAQADVLDRFGHIPLPPYIGRADIPLDRDRYQTVFAKEPGSIAAPTAGLHFTNELLEKIRARGVRVAEIVLHVSLGTFAKVEGEDIQAHRVAAESYFIPDETVRLHASTRETGSRVIAVGTTTTRTLESAIGEQGALKAGAGSTDLVIRPGHVFRAIDALVTNFHLPRSSLLFLVCALGGYDRVMSAYRDAVASGYRFFSYGDAMMILPQSPHR